VEGSPPTPPLLDLYKIAIDEYRFEVKLGWDRTMYYLVFNSAIISVGTGLLKSDNPPVAYLFVGGIFGLGLITSLIGYSAIRKGHAYYRRTIVKKTLLEDALGLTRQLSDYTARHNLSVGTTIGQTEHLRVLYDTERWLSRRPRRGSMTFFFRWLFVLIAVIDLAGFGTAIWLSFHPSNPPPAENRFIVPVRLARNSK
jgi:hypothetical protein